MTGTPPAVTVSLLTRMLVEAFAGPPGPWTYFTDASPGTGMFSTIRGLSAEQTSRDRGRSWTVTTVDDAGWADLQARLRREYQNLVVAVETHAVWDEDALGVAIGAIAHTAYHLGAIRQRLAPRP